MIYSGGGKVARSQPILDTFVKTPFVLTSEQRRLHEAYVQRWKFYLGEQSGYLAEDGELQLTINYTRALVDKINDFMFGNGFAYMADSNLWPFAEPFVRRVWSGTDKELLGLELGQMGGVMGDVYVKIWWDDDPYSTTFNTVQFSVIAPTNVVPVWEPGRMGKDRKMLECRIINVEHEISSEGNEEPTKVYYTTVYTPNEIVFYRDNTEVSREENALGEIPIVHIQNRALAGDYYGVSDIEDLMTIQSEINEKYSSVGNIISYQGSPVTVAYGIKSGSLSLEEGRIWYAPRKADGVDIENLDRNVDLRASKEYLDSLKESAHEMSSVPEASLGKQQPISNTSGVALHMQFLPITHLTKRKQKTYGPGLVEATRIGVKLMMIYDPYVIRDEFNKRLPIEIGPAVENADPRITQMYPQGTQLIVGLDSRDWMRAKVTVDWADVMPKDVLMEIEMARALQEMGLISDRKVLEIIVRTGAIDIKIDEIYDCIMEAREDQQQKLMAQSGWAGDFGGGGLTGETSAPGSGSAIQAPNERIGKSNSENLPKGA